MELGDWALRLKSDCKITSPGHYVLSLPPVCAQCQARLLGTWRFCPYCGVPSCGLTEVLEEQNSQLGSPRSIEPQQSVDSRLQTAKLT